MLETPAQWAAGCTKSLRLSTCSQLSLLLFLFACMPMESKVGNPPGLACFTIDYT